MFTKNSKKYLCASILVDLIFAATVLYYIEGKVYFGIYPIGVITGIALTIQAVLIILSGISIIKAGLKWEILLVIVIGILSIPIMGYLFLIWALVI